VLIPLAWWSMYAVNRWRVTGPVLGLIDSLAQQMNFWPVPAQPVAEAPAGGEAQASPAVASAIPPPPAQVANDALPAGAQPSVA
jgi:hypothetical protein